MVKKYFKYLNIFADCKDNEKVKPLCILLQKNEQTGKNEWLLEKYNKIWDTGSNSIKKGYDNEPV